MSVAPVQEPVDEAPLPLPLAVAGITPQWLTAALRRRLPDVTVTEVELVEPIWGTATKLRIRAAYAGGARADGPPEALCIKGGLDKRWRVKAVNALVKRLGLIESATAYRLEAQFYERLAPVLGAPLPRCWFAGVDLENGQGLVVLDDLVAAGVTFGDPTVPWSVDDVAAALEVQAAWHAGSWGGVGRGAAAASWRSGPGAVLRTYPWLPHTPIVGEMTPLLLSTVHWNTHFRRPQAPALPAQLQDRRVVLAAFARMWRRHQDEAVCISHGDAHLGNAYLDAASRPGYFDWQAVGPGSPLDDVSYFVTGALTVADRREHERSLLRHYLSALAARGVLAPSFDAAWDSYRVYALHGFLWASTPPIMQPWDRVRAMAHRHLTAILDLDSLNAG